MSIMLLHQPYQEAAARDRVARSVPRAGPPVLRPRLALALRAVAAWVAPADASAEGAVMPPRGPQRPRAGQSARGSRRRPAHGSGPPGLPAGQRRRDG